MAFVLVESLAKNKSRFVQMSCKIMELLLLSVGLISMVVVMKDSLRDFVFSISMGFWDFITCFFSSPPTVIIAINLMVLLIFASSTFYSSHQITTGDESPPAPAPSDVVLQVTPPAPPLPPAPAPSDVVLQVTPPAPPLPPAQPPSAIKSSINATQLQRGGRYDATHQLPSPKPQPPSRVIQARNNTTLTSGRRCDDVSAAHELPSPKPQPTPPPQPPPPVEKGKDVVIEEISDHHEEDTMEATWEAITGGGRGKQQIMKKKRPRAVKKNSTTWVDVEVERVRRLDSEEVVPSSPKWKELRKAETFNDAVSLTRRGGLIRKLPSMSLEDFNHKVEAFINNTLRHNKSNCKRTFFDIINQKQKRR